MAWHKSMVTLLGLFLVGGCVLIFIFITRVAPLEGVLKPVDATVTAEEVDTSNPPYSFLRTTFTFEVDGKSHTSSDALALSPAKEIQPNVEKKHPPGSHVTAWMWPGKPETAKLYPRTFAKDGWPTLEHHLLESMPIFAGLFLYLWLFWAAAARPAAAGLCHRVESGRSMWVRLKWLQGSDNIAEEAFGTLAAVLILNHLGAFQDFGSILMVIFCLSFATSVYLTCTMLRNSRRHIAELSADLLARTVRLPVYRRSAPAMEYRSVDLDSIECFDVIPEQCPDSNNYSNDWLLVARMKPTMAPSQRVGLSDSTVTDGEVIPVARYGNFFGTVVGVFGVQILARWLNDQLGLDHFASLVGRKAGIDFEVQARRG